MNRSKMARLNKMGSINNYKPLRTAHDLDKVTDELKPKLERSFFKKTNR